MIIIHIAAAIQYRLRVVGDACAHARARAKRAHFAHAHTHAVVFCDELCVRTRYDLREELANVGGYEFF